MRRRYRYLWTVRYRREGWKFTQSKFFKQHAAAERFIDKLEKGRATLAPIEHLVLEREALGPRQIIQRWRRPDETLDSEAPEAEAVDSLKRGGGRGGDRL